MAVAKAMRMRTIRFPGVPFRDLRRPRRLLQPFSKERGMRPEGFGSLLWRAVPNEPPHARWSPTAD